MRINKYIASCGVCSRRKADDLVLSGVVFVNGKKIDSFMEIDPNNDTITVNGSQIKLEKTKYYVALNKPKGIVTTASDERGRDNVVELIDDIDARLFPVGRLDYNTTGLIILTNDGHFANCVAHPKNIISKTYIAHIKGIPEPCELDILRKGIKLEDGKTAPAKVEILKRYPSSSEVSISIHEGRNRQIRRMFEALGHDMIELQRISIGNVLLGNLPLGRWRHLTSHEINSLKNESKRN